MSDLIGLDRDAIVSMIAEQIKKNRTKPKPYDSAYRRAYYAVNKDRIKAKEIEMREYYDELEEKFDIILDENKKLREENKLLKAMLGKA